MQIGQIMPITTVDEATFDINIKLEDIVFSEKGGLSLCFKGDVFNLTRGLPIKHTTIDIRKDTVDKILSHYGRVIQ